MQKTNIIFIVALVCSLFLAGCSALVSDGQQRVNASSSLVDFLYPKGEERQAQVPQIPVLSLPLNVGISFIPSKSYLRAGLSQGEQIALLEKVKAQFAKYEYINRIDVIPSTYLKGGEGFTTLDQVSRLYNIDVMALVSYDQLARTNDNNAALLYWTIVGMYVVPASDTSVQTFVDTAVFDVKSRSLLFRAPGLSKTKDRSTAINVDKVTIEKTVEGFDLAVDDMTINLESELARFEIRVKEEKIAKVERKEGYSGGSMFWMVITLSCAVWVRRFKR